MCGRYTTEIETDERELFRILARAEKNRYDPSAAHLSNDTSITAIGGREVFPSDTAAMLTADSMGNIDAFFSHWGFDADIGARHRLIINARSEAVPERPMFAPHFHSHRCIIPTAGFFEWAHTGVRADPDRKYRFNLPHTGILYLAGLYRPVLDVMGKQRLEFVILTRDASDSMRPIHDRMPVIIRCEHIQEYLGDTAGAGRLLSETPPVLIKKLVS